MTKTNDLFMPRTTVRRDSAPYQEALRLAKQHRHRDDGDETTNPRQPFWIEAEARAVIGRHLIVLEDGGDAAGGCWACTCPVAEHPDGEQRWFCPAANGMICDTCCEHDMDDGTTGLRAWGDGPCIGCEHFNEHRLHARPARVERCIKCDGQIAAGTWAYHVYRRGRWMPEGVDTLSVDDCDGVDIDLFPFLPPPSDNGWEWQHRVCGFLLEDVMSSDRRTDGDRPDETA